MNKNMLRSMISAFNVNDEVMIHFRGESAPISATVIEKKTGKGKGGSLLAVIEDENGIFRMIGTPKNEEIISLEHNGTFCGAHDERGDLLAPEPNPALAAEIKAALRSVLGDGGIGRKIRLTSHFKPLNGVFTILSARPEKGRFGQIHLQLTSDEPSDGFVMDLWSYRHSGLISSLELLPESEIPDELPPASVSVVPISENRLISVNVPVGPTTTT